MAILIFAAFVVSVFIVILSVPVERLDQVVGGGTDRFVGEAPELESGSLIRLKDLKTYFHMSEAALNQSFSEWYEFNEGLAFEIVDNERIYLLKNIYLPRVLKNDCAVIYCFQHRMQFDQIPSVFWNGLIGIEDYRFLDHFGVDLKSIARAIWVDLVQMRLAQGGSTLTQQLAKNLFYSNEKTFRRKYQEMITAIYIDAKYPKESILEAYFNEVYWGAFQGIQVKGIFAASVFYFDKTPEEVSPYEAAILIGLLRGPNFYHPIRHLERLKNRTEVVYRRLIEIGLFSDRQDVAWSDSEWQEWQSELKKRIEQRHLYAFWHFNREYQENVFSSWEAYESWVLFRSAHQKLREIRNQVHGGEKSELDLSLKIFMKKRPRSDREISSEQIISFYSKVERNNDVAIKNEKHQIGSTLKPILYRLFYDHGVELDDRVELGPFSLELISGVWSPSELPMRDNLEDISVGEALWRSLNRPVIRLAQQIGFEQIENDLLEKYNISINGPLAEYPAKLLGALELSVEELTEATEKFVLRECELADGPDGMGLVLEHMSYPERTTLRRVVQAGLSGLRFYGKTGTSNQGNDTWFTFYDGEHLGSIWLGNEGRRSSENIGIYGSSAAYGVYGEFARYSGKRFPEMRCH